MCFLFDTFSTCMIMIILSWKDHKRCCSIFSIIKVKLNSVYYRALFPFTADRNELLIKKSKIHVLASDSLGLKLSFMN